MGREVVCVECGEKVVRRDDLIVAGKLMHPYHKACHEQARKRLLLRFDPIDSEGFWRLLLGLNLLLGGICLAFPGSWTDIRGFILVTNVPLLLYRGLVYLTWERHLP